jgi:predicted O-linked N-acetylglucosamine transferase (SPINDLY family)
VFGWLSKRAKSARPAATDAADRLVSEGNRAEDAGNLLHACELYRRAVALAPRYAKPHINLGIALEAMGDGAGAIACYEQAIASDPVNPAASYNLGKLLYARGEFAQAERRLQQALRSRPDFPDARIVYAYVLQAQGKLETAVSQLRAALRQRPGDASASAALFHLLEAKGDLAGAAAELETVLKEKPDWTEALYNYGTTLMKLGRDAEAETSLRRVIALDPGFLLAYRMLGNLLHRHGRIEEMLEVCRAGRVRLPESFDLESFELLELNFTETPSEEVLFRLHRAFGERLERTYPRRFEWQQDLAATDRRLRVGYVSSDFNYHPVGLFMLPVLERHDRTRFEAYCYATSTKVDDFTRRLSARADLWRDVHALSEAQLADAIHDDRIDILIDLAGHSGVCRLGVFAQQPAPVQASWLGYLNTTGLSRIQYRITDHYCDPVGLTERWHTESLVRLPNSQWCYRPFVSVSHAPMPPLERNGHVTFGSFNQIAKVSRTTRRLWAQILSQLPDSRLVVAGVAEGRAAEGLLGDLAAAGIARARITLVPFLAVQDYLRWYDAVDIALDPSPYSGGTTTCDALWMGVPVLTVAGSRPASRSAASVLTTVGLPEWIAPTAQDYVQRAVEFSRQRETISALRASLRERMRASPLMDEEQFTRELEQAYREMWRKRWEKVPE